MRCVRSQVCRQRETAVAEGALKQFLSCAGTGSTSWCLCDSLMSFLNGEFVTMFGLTEEQEQLRKEVRSFAEREVAPHVSEWDEKSEFPRQVVKKLGEMGLMGVIFPEELGGAGMGYVEYVLAGEELSRVDGSVGIIVASHNSLCTNHIYLAGNDAQKKKYVSKLASGEWLGAWGLTEPGAGADAGGMGATAGRGGGGGGVNG